MRSACSPECRNIPPHVGQDYHFSCGESRMAAITCAVPPVCLASPHLDLNPDRRSRTIWPEARSRKYTEKEEKRNTAEEESFSPHSVNFTPGNLHWGGGGGGRARIKPKPPTRRIGSFMRRVPPRGSERAGLASWRDIPDISISPSSPRH